MLGCSCDVKCGEFLIAVLFNEKFIRSVWLKGRILEAARKLNAGTGRYCRFTYCNSVGTSNLISACISKADIVLVSTLDVSPFDDDICRAVCYDLDFGCLCSYGRGKVRSFDLRIGRECFDFERVTLASLKTGNTQDSFFCAFSGNDGAFEFSATGVNLERRSALKCRERKCHCFKLRSCNNVCRSLDLL